MRRVIPVAALAAALLALAGCATPAPGVPAAMAIQSGSNGFALQLCSSKTVQSVNAAVVAKGARTVFWQAAGSVHVAAGSLLTTTAVADSFTTVTTASDPVLAGADQLTVALASSTGEIDASFDLTQLDPADAASWLTPDGRLTAKPCG